VPRFLKIFFPVLKLLAFCSIFLISLLWLDVEAIGLLRTMEVKMVMKVVLTSIAIVSLVAIASPGRFEWVD
jgi:hypothetical protein